MSEDLRLGLRAAELRRVFDDAFGEAARPPAAETWDLLAVRVAGDPYALRMTGLAGLTSSRKIVPVPSRRRALLGVVGLRASAVPVYDLATLLGHDAGRAATTSEARGTVSGGAGHIPTRSAPGAPGRWLALVGGADPVALAFEELEGFHRVPQATVSRAEGPDASRPHVTEVVRLAGSTRPIVDLRATVLLLGAVTAGPSGRTKER